MPDATQRPDLPASNVSQRERKLARQKRLLAVLGVVLIVIGGVVLVALRRLPAPMRIMAGLGDIFMGCVLLVLVRQAARK